jgi:hypothetical protein
MIGMSSGVTLDANPISMKALMSIRKLIISHRAMRLQGKITSARM